MTYRFHHKSVEIGKSPELDALLVAAMRDAAEMNSGPLPNVWLEDYEGYCRLCRGLQIEPLTREQARTIDGITWGTKP